MGLLQEQYSFIMSCAHHKVEMLPQANTMVVSTPFASKEAWTNSQDPNAWRPYVLHYCQSYNYQGFNFHKALVTRTGWYADHFNNAIPGVLDCGSPTLQEPPPPPDSREEPDLGKRKTAWFLYNLLPKINAAAKAFRQRYCNAPDSNSKTPRLARTLHPKNCQPVRGRKT